MNAYSYVMIVNEICNMLDLLISFTNENF